MLATYLAEDAMPSAESFPRKTSDPPTADSSTDTKKNIKMNLRRGTAQQWSAANP
jgi:hypothetical protein